MDRTGNTGPIPWYERSYRRNLVDMHIPDWDARLLAQVDPQDYVSKLDTAQIDTAMIYSSSCLGICYWPTKHGHMHEGLNGRDLLGEILEGCHRRGINTIVYYNFWSKWAYDQHPEWRVVSVNGEGTADYLSPRFGVCCPNSPYRDFVVAQLEDLCGRYEFDGMWIDMIFWPYTACYCPYCRKRYDAEIGGELPRTVSWGDPSWVTFQRKREQWLAETAALLTRTVKQRKPRATVGHQCAAWSTGWRGGLTNAFFKECDYVSGDFYGDALQQSFTCKLLYHLTENKPFEFMTSRCLDLYHHTTSKTRDLLKAQVYSAVANGGAFLFIDAIDPAGTLDPNAYILMGDIFNDSSRYESFLSPDAEFCADVGIYFNLESLINLGDDGKDIAAASREIPLITTATGAAKALIANNVPFGIITEKNLEELASYQVIILPDVLMINDREEQAFKEFVRSGGSIYASKHTSLLSREGLRQNDFQLADLFGVSYLSETNEDVTYVAPIEEDGGSFCLCYNERPLEIMGSQVLVRAREDARVLATITLPYTDPADPSRFASAISNPPGLATQFPAIVERSYGQGKVLYVSGTLEAAEGKAQEDTFISLIRRIAPKPLRFESDAPRPVELTLFHQREHKRYVMNLLNFQSDLPNIPVERVKVRIRLDKKTPDQLVMLPEGQNVAYRFQAGYVEFTAPRLETFLMFALTYK